jgi:hypothetical protein
MIGSVSLTGGFSNFILPRENFSLGANGSKEFDVSFAPVVDGVNLSAQVNVTATDGSTGGWSAQKNISINGIGAFAALIDFRGTLPNFGSVVYGRGRYKEIEITLQNLGVRPFGQGTFEFPNGSPFSCVSPVDPIDGKCHYDIGPNGSATITLRFTPKSAGAIDQNMTLSSLPDYNIRVTGTGVSPFFNYMEN